ncbi:YMGG-like glycine zipper-containing protein [Nitrosovibrio tenuis]|nr:YMGG-like glycine zipper-containing protein [Nitrosovibrio tenuis]
MRKMFRLSTLLAALSLGACVSIPSGPSVMVLPGSGKNFDQFRVDDLSCKQYATEQVKGITPNEASISSGVGSAAVGTALGAAAGAAIGGGTGAAIGAGSGFALGGLTGSSSARASGEIGQQRYDMGYVQCMYAKGHRVPIAGQIMDNSAAGGRGQSMSSPPPPPPTGNPPPPPPSGYSPPPPPR